MRQKSACKVNVSRRSLAILAFFGIALLGIMGCGTNSAPLSTAPTANANIALSASTSAVRAGQSTKIDVSGTQIDVSQVTWSVSCQSNGVSSCGTVAGGVFTAPSSVPNGGAVLVNASAPVTGQSPVTASVSLTILNPSPVLLSASPAALVPGPVTIALLGSGFTPKSVVSVAADSSLSVQPSSSYISANQINVSLVTPTGFAGILTLTISNPDPGAATSTSLNIKVTPQPTLSINATNAQLRVAQSTAVSLTGNQVDMSQVAVTVACQPDPKSDCGSLAAGLYTAPAIAPGNGGAVTLNAKATVSGVETITSSVSLQILNPLPVLLAVTPTALQSGTSVVYVTGTGFTAQSVVSVTSSASTQIQSSSTFLDPTRIAVQVTTPSTFNGQLVFQVTNPDPGAALSGTALVQVTAPLSYDAAVRFLRQSTYGPTPALIAHVQAIGFSAFLDEQFAASPSLYNTPQWWQQLRFSIMRNAVVGNDQLRQRVSQALSEIIVASEFGQSADQSAFPVWMNTLQNDAFGNYGQVLSDTVKLPALAAFLTNIGNNATTDPTQHVSQNLGRELLQLFSVGPYLLNTDGTTVLDSRGNPIATYDNSVIDGVSRALTGWDFSQCNNNQTCMWQTALTGSDQKHDPQAKQFLGGTSEPAGGTATQDLNALIGNIMQHPNVAPFVGRRLIQALVTSNPSPQYIARISQVFQNDGTGTSGNLRAVVKAILLDPEARAADDQSVAASSGHVQEPILFAVGAMRAVGISMQPLLSTAPVGEDSPGPWSAGDVVDLETWSGAMGEQPLYSPSVFNFFSWQNTLPGTSTFAPEMQLETTSTVIAKANYVSDLLYGYLSQDTQNVNWLSADASNSATLVSDLNHFLLAGRMDTSSCNSVAAAVDVIPANDTNGRIRQAFYLFLTSPQYQVVQ